MAKEKKLVEEAGVYQAPAAVESGPVVTSVEEVIAAMNQIMHHRMMCHYNSGQHESARLAQSEIENEARRELSVWHDQEANKLAAKLAEVFPSSPLKFFTANRAAEIAARTA